MHTACGILLRKEGSLCCILQAYGAKQYPLVGYIWQRAIIILGLLCIPISVLLLFAQPILLATGQTPKVAAMTASYIR